MTIKTEKHRSLSIIVLPVQNLGGGGGGGATALTSKVSDYLRVDAYLIFISKRYCSRLVEISVISQV